jgi:lipoprotein-anchoring transpeptidase ErfK/SrfK
MDRRSLRSIFRLFFGARLKPGAAVVAALSVALMAGAPAAVASTPPPGSPVTGSPTTTSPTSPVNGPAPKSRPDVILSNETTNTTFTFADVAAPIRAQPSAHAKILHTLAFQTPDGFVQTYILLRERWVKAQPWIELRIPMRPNGKIGWVPRNTLDEFQVIHTELVVNRAAEHLTLYRNGRAFYNAPVGTGKPGTPTPPGHFWITESFVSTDPFYGPYAFGTSDYSTLTDWPGGGIVGLHGTNEPALVPGHPSHGCIRLHNSDVVALSHLVPIGTPLLII